MAWKFSFSVGKDKEQQESKAYTPQIGTGTSSVQPISIGNFTPIQAALSIFGYGWEATRFMYENIPEFAAPINFIIDKVVEIPDLYQEFKGKDWAYVEDPYSKLWKKPNQFQNQEEFWRVVLLHKFIYGEQFINKVFPVGMSKYIDKIFALPAPEIAINFKNNFDSDWRLREHESYFWKAKTIYPESIIYRKDINALSAPDQRGVSRLNSLRNTGKELQAISEAGIKTIEDRGSMGLIFPESNGALADPDIAALKKAYYEKIGITGDKMPFLITNRPLQYVSTGMNVQELGLDAARLKDFRTVCMVLKVPSQLLNDVVNSTYNNMSTIRRTFYENAVVPEVESICKLKAEILNLEDKARYIPDYSNVTAMQADVKLMSDIAISQYNAGLITGDEAREVIGYDAKKMDFKTQNNGTNSGANQAN